MTFIDNLIKYGHRIEYKKDDLIFMQGDVGKHMFIILSGSVGVYINTYDDFPIKVNTIDEKNFFGEMSIIDDEPRSATIIAETDCILYGLSKDDFNDIMVNEPSLSLQILTTLSRRIRSMNNTMATLRKGTEKDDTHKLDDDNIFPMITDEKVQYNKTAPTLREGFLYERLFNCPMCENAFKAKYPLFTKLETVRIERDLRRHYKDFDILLYTIIVCPKCSYANIYSSFNEVRFTEPDKTAFLELELKFSRFSEPRTINKVIESYYLALKCDNVLKMDYSDKAKILMRLSWLYKDLGETDRYKKIQAKALECYEYIYNTMPHSSSINGDQQLSTILAELYLAKDNKEKAIEHYKKVFKIGKNGNIELYEQSLEVLYELGVKREDLR